MSADAFATALEYCEHKVMIFTDTSTTAITLAATLKPSIAVKLCNCQLLPSAIVDSFAQPAYREVAMSSHVIRGILAMSEPMDAAWIGF